MENLLMQILGESEQGTIAILAVARHRAEQEFRAIRAVQCPDSAWDKAKASPDCLAAYDRYLNALAMLEAYLDRMDQSDLTAH